MTRVRWRLPADNLGRTRLATAILGCLTLAPHLGQGGNPLHSDSWGRLGTICIATAIATMLLTYVRGRTFWCDPVVLPVLVAAGASGLKDPLAGTALALGTIMVLSLYGTMTTWVVRSLGLLVAVPVAVALTPQSLGRAISWHEPAVLGLLPSLLLMSAMMRGIYVSLRHQERAAARDAVLARTGTEILAAGDVAEVYELSARAATEIIALHPGLAMLVLRRVEHDEAGLRVRTLAGLPEELRGRVVPDSVLADPAALRELAGGFRTWRVESFPGDLHVAVGGVKRVPAEVVDAVRTLSNQVVLGEGAIRSHAELDHQANHDALTQLTARAKFFRELTAAVDERPPEPGLSATDLTRCADIAMSTRS